MGGVATAVENYLKPNAIKVTEGEGNDEYVVTRLDICNPALNVVNIYGEQEGRSGKEKVIEGWNRLRRDLDRIKLKGEFCFLVGDFNKKVGNDDMGVEGNRPEISFGGKLVRNLIASGEYVLVNNTEVAKGGPFTRVDPANANKKSCLGLVIVSANPMPFITELLLYKHREVTPLRVGKEGK